MPNCNESTATVVSGGCESVQATDLLNSILEQDRAIEVRWGQLFQAGGITPNALSSVTVGDVSGCSGAREALLTAILEQRTGIFNAMFVG